MTTLAVGKWNAREVVRGALLVGLAGLALVLVGFLIDRRQAAFSYLAAFAFWLSLALGALIFVMIHHAMNSSWFVVLRRPAEAAAATIPLLILLFLPILVGARELYPWTASTAELPASLADAVERKRVYLNLPFFVVRAALYFSIWSVAALLLRRWSLKQETGDGTAIALRQRTLGAVLLPPVAFALTFAAFDWLMSLTPTWYSTVFGVYYFAGGALGALTLLAVAARLLGGTGELAGRITASHVHALGKLILTFLIFWAYIAFVQLLLIWIADLPEEVGWYWVRMRGGWAAVGWLLVLGHFLVPLFALLSREVKRRSATLGAIAVGLLVMHYVDVYWLVLPALHPDGPVPHWLDLAALAGVGGTTVAYGTRLLGSAPLLPLGDPRLERSLDFKTT